MAGKARGRKNVLQCMGGPLVDKKGAQRGRQGYVASGEKSRVVKEVGGGGGGFCYTCHVPHSGGVLTPFQTDCVSRSSLPKGPFAVSRKGGNSSEGHAMRGRNRMIPANIEVHRLPQREALKGKKQTR